MRKALREGASVNSKDPSTGDTALFAAAADDADAKVVVDLVKAGADVNAADASGWTPLIWVVSKATAMDKGLWRAVEVLVKSGAKVGAKNKDGDSALSLAKKAKASRIVTILERGAKSATDPGR